MRARRSLVCILSLLVLVFAPMIFAHAVTSYLPAVTPGVFAKYKPLTNVCTSQIPTICQSNGLGFGDTDYGSVQIVDVQGEDVTFELITAYTNGTIAEQGASVNVSTGESNVTNIPGLTGPSSDYFVLAGGLQTPDSIWNTVSAPTFNQTATVNVLGVFRDVNFLNHTSSISIGGYTAAMSTGFAFDKESGMLIELSFKIASTYGFQVSSGIGMVENNIWLVPDFSISPSGPISFQTGSTGSATITVTAHNGFTSTINLQATTPSGLSCMLSKGSLPGYGTFTVTCRGEPGSHNATINATSGSTTHSTPVSVQISSAPVLNQPSRSLMPWLYVAIGTVAVIALLAAYLVLRRRPVQPAIAPAVTTAPSSTS